MMKTLHVLASATLLACAMHAQAARPNIVAVPGCGHLENHYGPFDYRGAEPAQIHIVEIGHFTPRVEALAKGGNNPFGDDLAYTLRVLPNHIRALITLVRLTEKEKTDQPVGARFPVECYFIRAVTFVPDDHIVRMLYADFLRKRNRPDDARQQLDYAVSTTLDNPLAQLNAGKLYLDLKDYDRALIQAHRLLAMGVERPDLKDALVAVGRWVEPRIPASGDAASGPAGVASASSSASAP